jgi:hypothetical protein
MITWFVPANNCSVVIRLGGPGLTTIDLASVFFMMAVRILLINMRIKGVQKTQSLKFIKHTMTEQEHAALDK